jgi:hypothetical protein
MSVSSSGWPLRARVTHVSGRARRDDSNDVLAVALSLPVAELSATVHSDNMGDFLVAGAT